MIDNNTDDKIREGVKSVDWGWIFRHTIKNAAIFIVMLCAPILLFHYIGEAIPSIVAVKSGIAMIAGLTVYWYMGGELFG